MAQTRWWVALLGLAMLLAASTVRADAAPPLVELNTATEAQLDGIKGIGPALSGRLLQARAAGAFQSWDALMQRVPGIGAKSAQRLSWAGLRVAGQAYGDVGNPASPAAPSPGAFGAQAPSQAP